MWSLFDDIKLKLKDEGNCFVNLGDTYAGSGNGYGSIDPKNITLCMSGGKSKPIKFKSIPAKCLCMIPQRFAWGMIERGWVLRNEIIWYKPNHMPESVTDRLTKAHEVIYHFVKQSKYYYDLDAIREPHKTNEKSREWGYNGKYEGNKLHEDFGSPRARTQRNRTIEGQIGNDTSMHWGEDAKGKNPGDVLSVHVIHTVQDLIKQWKSMHPEDWGMPHDVWQINTQPYPEAHFAVFPIELARRPILAGCPPRGHVLDPFGGSGTVAEFCRKNDRDCTIYELNPDYKPLIEERGMIKIPELSEYLQAVG